MKPSGPTKMHSSGGDSGLDANMNAHPVWGLLGSRFVSLVPMGDKKLRTKQYGLVVPI